MKSASGRIILGGSRRRARLALTMILLSVTSAASPSNADSLMRTFLEVGSSRFEDEENGYTEIGFRVGQLAPGGPGVDFAMHAWLVPGLVLTPDLDLCVPIPLGGDARLIPRAGVSALVVAGGEIAAAVAGANVGVGVALGVNESVSFRMDYSVRRFFDEGLDDGVAMHSFSIGVSFGGGPDR